MKELFFANDRRFHIKFNNFYKNVYLSSEEAKPLPRLFLNKAGAALTLVAQVGRLQRLIGGRGDITISVIIQDSGNARAN